MRIECARATRITIALLLAFGAAVAGVAAGGDGGGYGFLLGGTAQNSRDPENPANETIRIDTSTGGFGTVSRPLNTKISTLDNQLELKAYFVAPKTCVGGSPRVQLAIDLNGDGQSDGNAHGYVGTLPFGAGCVSNVWQYFDLTDLVARWDVTQLTGVGELVLPGGQNPFTVPWDVFEAAVSLFPLHKVCSGALVDDTFGIPGMSGIAHYDLISIGRATWSNHRDTAGRGFAMGCARPQHDDDDHDDDHDKDHDRDDDDDKYDDDRRRRHDDDN
jgi:hypothetical protein